MPIIHIAPESCPLTSFDEEKTMKLIPCEFTIGGVYFPPLLMASILGVMATILAAQLLNRYRLSRYFFYPLSVFLALTAISNSFASSIRKGRYAYTERVTFIGLKFNYIWAYLIINDD